MHTRVQTSTNIMYLQGEALHDVYIHVYMYIHCICVHAGAGKTEKQDCGPRYIWMSLLGKQKTLFEKLTSRFMILQVSQANISLSEN